MPHGSQVCDTGDKTRFNFNGIHISVAGFVEIAVAIIGQTDVVPGFVAFWFQFHSLLKSRSRLGQLGIAQHHRADIELLSHFSGIGSLARYGKRISRSCLSRRRQGYGGC